jgi:hypothetical protein
MREDLKPTTADYVLVALVLLAVMMTVLAYLAVDGPAVEVRDWKVPQPSLPMVLFRALTYLTQ